MCEDYYRVLIDGLVIAEKVSLNYAILFVKTIVQEYYNDTEMTVGIQRMTEVSE